MMIPLQVATAAQPEVAQHSEDTDRRRILHLPFLPSPTFCRSAH